MKKILSILCVLANLMVYAQDKKISQLPALPAVSGNEAIPLAISGTNYYVTPNQLKTWFNNTYIPLVDTGKFIPLVGTNPSHNVTGIIEAKVGGGNLLYTKDPSGFLIGYGDNRNNLFGSTQIYAASFFDSLQTYLQYYNYVTQYGAEFNLAGSDGSGGNGTFARIAAIDYGAGHGTSTNWLLDAITVKGNTSSFKGMMYDNDYSPYFTKYTLVDSNWVALHCAPLSSGGYLKKTGDTLTGLITYNSTPFSTAMGSTGTFFVGSGNVANISSASNAGYTKYASSSYGAGYFDASYSSGFGASSNFANINVNNNGSTLTELDFTVQSCLSKSTYSLFPGIQYDSDYSAHYTTRSLIDKGYADATYAPLTTTLSGTGYVKQSGSSTSYITSIPNTDLANSTFTVNGTGMALGTSSTIACAAGTLTGTALNASVVTSSLTTVGTVTTGVWNARVQPRLGTITTASVITINTDGYDIYTVTSLSTATTFTIPSGTPTQGQGLIIRIKDNGTARALSFTTGASGAFRFSSDAPAPTTTTANKTMYIYAVYNTDDNVWDCTGWRDNY